MALLAGRSVQGIGGGGILSLNLVILTDVVPLRQRPAYLAITQGAWAIGTIIGPLIGGLFAQHTTWRWVFYVNFPLCGICLVLVPFSVKLYAEGPSVKTRLMRLDWIGMTLFIPSVSSFLIGVTWGGSQFAWGSFHTLVPIVVGVVGLAATVVWEVYGASRPFLRLSLLNSRSGSAAHICALLQGVLVSSFFLRMTRSKVCSLLTQCVLPAELWDVLSACVFRRRKMRLADDHWRQSYTHLRLPHTHEHCCRSVYTANWPFPMGYMVWLVYRNLRIRSPDSLRFQHPRLCLGFNLDCARPGSGADLDGTEFLHPGHGRQSGCRVCRCYVHICANRRNVYRSGGRKYTLPEHHENPSDRPELAHDGGHQHRGSVNPDLQLPTA